MTNERLISQTDKYILESGVEENDDPEDMPDLPMTDPRYIAWTRRVRGKGGQPDAPVLIADFSPYHQSTAKPFFEIKSAVQAAVGAFRLGLDESGTLVEIPPSINRFLRKYQRDGVRFFWEHYQKNEGGLLGDDMGLGKTIQVISFLTAIMGTRFVPYCLSPGC